MGEAEARGQFVFKAHRVQGFLTILAGVCDLLDPRHSAGVWTEAAQDEVPGGPAGEEASDYV